MKTRSTPTGLRRARLGLVVGASVTLAACSERRAPRPEPTITQPTTSTNAIRESPERYYGKQVRLNGEVDKLYSPRAFQLEGAGWALGDNLVVLAPSPIEPGGAPLREDDEVVLTGTVRPFQLAELDRELGWNLDPTMESTLRDHPVVVAQRVRKIGELAAWDARGGTAAQPVTATVAILYAADLPAMVGRTVDLAREQVRQVAGKGLFIGPSDMSQIFVLPEAPLPELEAGDAVSVKGKLARRAPGDAARWDLPAKLLPGGGEALYIDHAQVQKLAPTASGRADTPSSPARAAAR